MRQQLPDEVMPLLFLTRSEELQVEHEASTMVREAIDGFRAFGANGRTFDKAHWKRVSEKEGFRVYRSRRDYATTVPFLHAPNESESFSQTLLSESVSSSSASSDGGSGGGSSSDRGTGAGVSTILEPSAAVRVPMMSKLEQFPVVVLTGIVAGTMDDVLFGAIANDAASWSLRNVYTQDGQRDGKILATLEGPTPDEPYRFLGIKWSWRELPSFMQERDMVFVENTGVVRDAQGDIEMGFTLMHSIRLPGVPELTQYDILRMKLSLCFLSRRYDDRSVELYCRAFTIPIGTIPRSIAVRVYADNLLHSADIIECANMKKLMWLTRHRQRQRRAASGRHARDTESGLANLESATHCQGCERTLKRFGGLNRSANLCRCCQRVVCGKCSSERKIVLDVADDGAVTQRALLFCLSCVLEARALPALDIARATAVRRLDYSDHLSV